MEEKRTPSPEEHEEMDSNKFAMAIAFGPMIGVFIGIAINNIAIGIIIGLNLGLFIGIAWSLR